MFSICWQVQWNCSVVIMLKLNETVHMVSPTLPMDCHYMYVNINKCNPENGFSWGNLIWEIRISGLFYTNYTITHACRIQFSPKQHGISWENKVLGSLQIHFTERVCGVCGA